MGARIVFLLYFLPLFKIRDPDKTRAMPMARFIVKASPKISTERIEPKRGINSL